MSGQAGGQVIVSPAGSVSCRGRTPTALRAAHHALARRLVSAFNPVVGPHDPVASGRHGSSRVGAEVQEVACRLRTPFRVGQGTNSRIDKHIVTGRLRHSLTVSSDRSRDVARRGAITRRRAVAVSRDDILGDQRRRTRALGAPVPPAAPAWSGERCLDYGPDRPITTPPGARTMAMVTPSMTRSGGETTSAPSRIA